MYQALQFPPYVPYTLPALADVPAPVAGDNGKALTYRHAFGDFVYTSFEAAGAVAAHVGLPDPHSQYLFDSAVSAFGLTLIDDADQATARGTLGLGTMALETAANYLLASGAKVGASASEQTLTLGAKLPKIQPLADGTASLKIKTAADAEFINLDTTNRNQKITSPAVSNRDVGPDQWSIVDTAGTPITRVAAVYDGNATRLVIKSPDGTKSFRMEAQNSSCNFTVPVGVVSFIGSGASGRIDFTADAGAAYLQVAPNGVTLTGGSADAVRMAIRGSSGQSSADILQVLTSGSVKVAGISVAGALAAGHANVATAFLDAGASTTTRASLRLRPGAFPTGGNRNDGDISYVTGARLKMYRGSTEEIFATGVQGAAITQTYATAARTVNDYTTDAEAAYTGQDALQVGNVYAKYADLESLRVAYTNLEADHLNLKQVVTAIIDDMQAFALN